MSDQLSQDDIDKLMNKGKSEDVAANTDAVKPLEYLSPIEADTLGEIGNISMGSSATTLSMLLSNKVDITTPTIKEFIKIEELFQQKGEFITVEIGYQQGLEGISIFAIEKRDSAIIADLMMGGTGDVPEDPEVGELQLSAVCEAMNQMMGSASTSMSSIFNFPVNITPPVIKLQDDAKNPDVAPDLIGVPIIAVVFKFTVGDLIDSEMVQVMSLASAQNLVSTLTNSMKSAVEEMPASQQAPASKPAEPAPSPQRQPASMGAQASPSQNPVTVQPVQFATFDNSHSVTGENGKNLDLLMDIKLKLTVELGRTELPIKKVLDLTRGSVIELDKIAGEPVELYANGKMIATGEVVVIEDNFGLRITSIVHPDSRIKNI